MKYMALMDSRRYFNVLVSEWVTRADPTHQARPPARPVARLALRSAPPRPPQPSRGRAEGAELRALCTRLVSPYCSA